MKSVKSLFTLISLLALVASARVEDYGSCGNLWKSMSEEERQEVDALAERFKVMIGDARSELLMVKETIRHAESPRLSRVGRRRSKLPPKPRR